MYERNNTSKNKRTSPDYFHALLKESWTYITTAVDVAHESVLLLDEDLRVIAANDSYYQTFQVKKPETEGVLMYKLGNQQWNIPSLQKLLKEIIPGNTFFNGFIVKHVFPTIGRRIMILNAREIHRRNDSGKNPIILLAIEDVTDMMSVAESLASQSRHYGEIINSTL